MWKPARYFSKSQENDQTLGVNKRLAAGRDFTTIDSGIDVRNIKVLRVLNIYTTADGIDRMGEFENEFVGKAVMGILDLPNVFRRVLRDRGFKGRLQRWV
jgi:hypothetical protein